MYIIFAKCRYRADWNDNTAACKIQLLAKCIIQLLAKCIIFVIIADAVQIKMADWTVHIEMASSSIVDDNSTVDVDVRFLLKQCECGEIADVKITKSNKNNNRGRIYYSCKRQICGTFLGWCKISSIQRPSNNIAVLEECSTSRASVVGEVHYKREIMPWKLLIILSFILSTFLAIKAIL